MQSVFATCQRARDRLFVLVPLLLRKFLQYGISHDECTSMSGDLACLMRVGPIWTAEEAPIVEDVVRQMYRDIVELVASSKRPAGVCMCTVLHVKTGACLSRPFVGL